MAILVTTSSIQAYQVPEEKFSDSLLYVLIEPENLGYLIEEKVSYKNEENEENYLSYGRLIKEDSPLTNEEEETLEEEGYSLTQGGTALVKPNISGDEQDVRKVDENYVVQQGDTISSIAEMFGVGVNTILWANGLTARSYIQPGGTLTIPPINGVYHSIKKGENISTIAKKYDADPRTIIDFNRLASAESIVAGQKLFIPNGKPLPVAPKASPWQSVKKIFNVDKTPSIAVGEYIWPTSCRRISQYYSWRHTGVDIACSLGTQIYASRAGVVIRSANGWNGGYGNVIIIEHSDGTQTLYGHNNEIYVSTGDSVSQGQVISAMGSTGRSTGPHIHFEVRAGGRRNNPLGYIH